MIECDNRIVIMNGLSAYILCNILLLLLRLDKYRCSKSFYNIKVGRSHKNNYEHLLILNII